MAFLFVVGVFQLEVGNPVTVTLLKGFAVSRCDIQITQQAVVNAIGPAVNGKQYVVISAGGHGSFGTKMGDYIVAYALPDDVK
jgi:hypothetical protein